MSAWGALAVQAGVLAFAAMVVAISGGVSDRSLNRADRWAAALFAAAVISGIASAWVAVAS